MRTTALASLLAAAPVAAPAFGDPPAEARLLAGWESAPGARVAGLEIALDPGWKTYWRSPGEAGIPPAFDWSGSENVAEVAVEWPAPLLFDSFGFATLGYADRVVLPLRVTSADPAAPARLALTLDYAVCAEICVPARAELTLDLAPGAPEAGRAAIVAARARLPVGAAEAGVAEAACALRGAGAERAVSAEIVFETAPPETPYLVIEGPDGVWVGPPETRMAGRSLTAEATAMLSDPAAWVARDAFDLTLIGRGWAAELPGCAVPRG